MPLLGMLCCLIDNFRSDSLNKIFIQAEHCLLRWSPADRMQETYFMLTS